MARAVHRLTDVVVRRTTKPGMYADGAGLYLRVGLTGGKAWIFRYRRGAKLHDLGLGPLHTISLANARRRAQQLREQRLDGVDLIAAKKASRIEAKIEAARSVTFAECARNYVAAHEVGWRNAKHRSQWSASLATHAFPILGDVPVGAIETGLVLKVLEPIWRTKPETASRLRGRIEAILDWARVRDYRQGENPARWRGHLESLLPPPARAKRAARVATGREEHYAALPYAELPDFMLALREQKGIAARALEFLILTAARTVEVLGATWSEIDIAARLWTVPGDRMKTGKEHRVPLSDSAVAIIEQMAKTPQGDFVFPGIRANRPLSNMALLMTLRRMKRADLTAHGFRSSFSDWCAEQTNVPAEVREMALAHSVGDKVEAAYRRGDLFEKRRLLAAAWTTYCEGSAGGDVVVPLRIGA